MPSVEATGQWTNPSTVDVFCTEICWIFTTMFDHQYHEISALLGTKKFSQEDLPPVNVLSFHEQLNHLASEKVCSQFARCRFSIKPPLSNSYRVFTLKATFPTPLKQFIYGIQHLSILRAEFPQKINAVAFLR